MAANVVETLNDLVQITHDSHDGYQRSAEDTKDPDLKALFQHLSTQREAMVADLQRLVRQQGGTPKDSGTMLAGAHRLFVDLKSLVTGTDRAAVLKEVERGESEAVRRYENALSQDLPGDVAAVIRRHLETFRSDKARITQLKQSAG